MIGVLFALLIILPWCAAGLLLVSNGQRPSFRRSVVVITTLLMAAGCLGLAVMDATPTLAFSQATDATESLLPGDRLAWSADRFSLVMVAALMVIISTTTILLNEESSSSALLTMLVAAVVPFWWWSETVWGLAGITVIAAFVSFVLPMMIAPSGTWLGARTQWLSQTLCDVVLVMAIVAGCAGLGDATIAVYGDPARGHEFATMRPATAMFVALWSWLGVLIRTGQFPLCVNFDTQYRFPAGAWVLSTGLGVFALGHRWSDLHRGWWSASPPMTNLILSAALVSALLCAWFALFTPDLRVRVAYLSAAQFSLALGPLTTGEDLERVWAAAIMLGSLSLATWFWSVTRTSVAAATHTEPDPAPPWLDILTGSDPHRATTPAAVPSPSSTPGSASLTAPRGLAMLFVLLGCGLGISAGSWWWEDEPTITVEAPPALADTATSSADLTPETVPTRPFGRLPVSTVTVMLIAAAFAAGVRSALPQPIVEGMATAQTAAGIVLCCAPVGLIVSLACSEQLLLQILGRTSPALACLVFAAMVTGWIIAGWPVEQRERFGAAFAAIRQLGEQRLSVPDLLRFGVNFPLRGLAQLIRFLNTSVIETSGGATLRRLPEILREFHHEIRSAGDGSDALVLLLSGVAVLTTLVWLAQ
ncbi:MAG TPA: hypothetical protein VFG20_04790 [Planctomycetaceae bacterium]|nr:hypothetical protein [Planctomycetaceae bacterium]